ERGELVRGPIRAERREDLDGEIASRQRELLYTGAHAGVGGTASRAAHAGHVERLRDAQQCVVGVRARDVELELGIENRPRRGARERALPLELGLRGEHPRMLPQRGFDETAEL